MGWVPSFEPAGFNSPIGRYKAFAKYQEGHHFRPEDHGATVFHAARGFNRRWLRFEDLRTPLTVALEDMLCCLERAVVGPDVDYNQLNSAFHHKWGNCATIVEVVPRFFHGIHGLIRLLPCIPQSTYGVPTCLLLRGLFKAPGPDYYAIDWDTWSDGFDPALFEGDRYRGDFQDRHELIRAFNSLAHARGLKTGFVVVTNSGQVYIDGQTIDWGNIQHQEVFIGKCLNAISLGFDAIYFDSARHCGGWDNWGNYHIWDAANYHGQGIPIPFHIMQRLTYEIRHRSGRSDIACFGEYTCQNPRFREMGLSGGLFYDATTIGNDYVYQVSEEQRGASDYKSGFFVSNDNDNGSRSFEDRLGAAWRALNAQARMARTPVLLTQVDLWPVTNTSYHDIVMQPIHWDDGSGFFHPNSSWYTWRMNEVIAEAA